MPVSYILFQVAGATYAVPADQVQQVEMVENITLVPNAPEFVEGIVYVRGKVIPVINLRKRFRMETIPYDLRSRLIVVHLDSRAIGIAVDAAREFLNLDPKEIQPPPDTLTGPGVEYLEGAVSVKDRLILVVNLKRLLTFEEKESLDESIETRRS